jgi:nuclear pore complex protein Nup160
MYQRALKLQDITTTAQLFVSFGEEQLDSLSIAINALTLVDENSQWVILPVIPDAVSRTLLCGNFDVHIPQSRKRKGSSKFIPETKFISAKYDSQIVHLADMQRQHTLLSGQIATVKRNPDILVSAGLWCCSLRVGVCTYNPVSTAEFLLPPTVLVLRLTHHSLFSQALTVASSLKVDMTEIFQQLTTQCIRLSKNPQAVMYVPQSLFI